MDDGDGFVGVWVSGDEGGEAGVQLLGRWRVCDGEEYVTGACAIQQLLQGRPHNIVDLRSQ